jgi:integrase
VGGNVPLVHVAGFTWTGWQLSHGLGGRLHVDWVATFPWIGWQTSVEYALRHTFGAHKADKNMSLATLQELMGHKKKETTLKYIHLAKTNLRQEMVQTAL